MTSTLGQVDVATIRAAFPIEQVVQQSGVDLRPSGHGFIGCCPFHDDSTPSLSVGGVPDRFTCFGCGARGDVIDFVQKLHGLSFVEAVRSLTSTGAIPTRELPRGIPSPQSASTPAPSVSAARGFDINQLAWGYLSTPIAVSFADSYLRFHRGIDLRPLRAEHPARRSSHTPATDGPPSPSTCAATGSRTKSCWRWTSPGPPAAAGWSTR